MSGDAETQVPATAMIRCPDCGRSVPQANLSIHQVTACSGRARPSVLSPQVRNNRDNAEEDPMEIDQEIIDVTTTIASTDAVVTTADVQHQNNGRQSVEQRSARRNSWLMNGPTIESDLAAVPSSRRGEPDVVDLCSPRTPRRGSNDGDDDDDQHSVVDLSEVDDSAAATPDANAPSSAADEWACAQCTLLNSNLNRRCEACGNPNPDRPPDPVRRERLIGGDFNYNDYEVRESRPASSYIGGGAFLGSMLSGAGAYFRGRPVGNAMLEGAVAGAVGGAVMDEVVRPPGTTGSGTSENPFVIPSGPSSAEAAAAAESAPPTRGDPRTILLVDRHGTPVARLRRPQPRRSFVVLRRSTRRGRSSQDDIDTVHMSEGGRPMRREDPMMALLMGQMFRSRIGGGGGNVDGMSYEQLLQTFGDGSENRGAEETTLSSLPTARIQDVERELPPDARQCLICLDDFKVGDVRKTLPCLHGFHEDCVDKWLRTNACCPICKHSVSNTPNTDP